MNLLAGLSAHSTGGFFHNVTNEYRIWLPAQRGRFEARSLKIYEKSNGEKKSIEVSGGFVSIENCVVEIKLLSQGRELPFNGVHKLPSYSCKPT